MTAPERIWAFEDVDMDGANPKSGIWIDEQSECPEGSPGYIRADLVAAQIAAAVQAALDGAEDLAIEGSVWSMPSGAMTSDEWRRGVTDARRDIAAAIRARKEGVG